MRGRLLGYLIAALAIGAALLLVTGGWGLSGLPFLLLVALLARGRYVGEATVARWRRTPPRPRRRAATVLAAPALALDLPSSLRDALVRSRPRRGPPSLVTA